MRVDCRSAMVPTTPWGARPSEHSPQPVMPSSVSTFTKVQGRHPASTIKVSICVIFIYCSSFSRLALGEYRHFPGAFLARRCMLRRGKALWEGHQDTLLSGFPTFAASLTVGRIARVC